MSTTTDTDWTAEAVRLRREEKMETALIAERVGRSPSRVRRVLAEANAERAINGSHSEEVTPEMLESLSREATIVRTNEALQSNEPQGDITAALTNPEDPLEAFKREAGESVGDMPPQDPPRDPEPSEVRFAGSRQTCLDFGPNADLPTGGTIVIKSEKLASGHFGLGDVITGTFTARITGMAPKEKYDTASEEFRAKTTPYEATMTEVSFKPVDSDE
jgi:hypothetical protein